MLDGQGWVSKCGYEKTEWEVGNDQNVIYKMQNSQITKNWLKSLSPTQSHTV